jgi:hypothetical protein
VGIDEKQDGYDLGDMGIAVEGYFFLMGVNASIDGVNGKDSGNDYSRR